MSNLNYLLKEINKKYGEGTVRTANEFPDLTRIPTGIFALDASIGGGIPKGRICIFSGNESTGKTSVAKMALAQFQSTCKNCLLKLNKCNCGNTEPHVAVMVDIEGAFDPNWFTTLGGNVDDLILFQPEFAEQGVDVVEALVRSGEVDIIVVDSVAMMSPADEIEKSSEDLLVGTHARLMNRMMRSVQSGMNSLGMGSRKPSVILINQLRQKVGVLYGDNTTLPGGLGQKFASSITVKFTARPSELVYADKGKKDDSPLGVTIRFNVTKNKTFVPLKTGMFILYVADSKLGAKGSINIEEQIVDYAVNYGVIEKSGAWFTMGNEQYQGKNSVIEALINDDSLRDDITQKTMDTAITNMKFGEQSDETETEL